VIIKTIPRNRKLLNLAPAIPVELKYIFLISIWKFGIRLGYAQHYDFEPQIMLSVCLTFQSTWASYVQHLKWLWNISFQCFRKRVGPIMKRENTTVC